MMVMVRQITMMAANARARSPWGTRKLSVGGLLLAMVASCVVIAALVAADVDVRVGSWNVRPPHPCPSS